MSTRVRKEAFTLIELPAVRQRGFTLIELLVVIGIIAVLMGLLLPVINKMRWASYQANTAALVANLSAATQRYYEDFRAYPGPIPDSDLRNPTPSAGVAAIAVITPPPPPANPLYDLPANTFSTGGKITGAENLLLGLSGGLRLNGAVVSYDPLMIGKGPASLNSANPKTYPVYAEPANITASFNKASALVSGHFKDDAADADDSVIPEFVDRYPSPMPILYMRAKVAVNSTTNTAANNPVITDGTGTGAYNLKHIIGYTGAYTNAYPALTLDTGSQPSAAAKSIGVGKGLKIADYKPTVSSPSPLPWHGLRSVTPVASTVVLDAATQYPFDAYLYVRDPGATTAAIVQPRAKDMYILISAGPDRVYGTSDDITSFGAVQP